MAENTGNLAATPAPLHGMAPGNRTIRLRSSLKPQTREKRREAMHNNHTFPAHEASTEQENSVILLPITVKISTVSVG